MAFNRTIGTMVTLCRQRCDNENNNHLTDPEYKSLLSEAYGEVHALVTEKGARYFETDATLNLSNLALPSDHLTTIGIDFVMSGTTGPRRPVFGPVPPEQRTYLVGGTK